MTENATNELIDILLDFILGQQKTIIFLVAFNQSNYKLSDDLIDQIVENERYMRTMIDRVKTSASFRAR
jgi:hypothetical protein